MGSDGLEIKQGIFDLTQFNNVEDEKDIKDPQAGLMNMMKKMYEEGDANTKKSIAEAWTKANDKKAQGGAPDFSDRMDFLGK